MEPIPARLTSRVVLISGTGRGMGRAAARRFAAEGATVVGGDIDVATAQETAALVESDGYAMHDHSPLDVTDEGSVRDWVADATGRFGRIDVLYNNAGAVRWGAIEEQSYADWRFTVSAELDSVWLCSRAAWPHLKASRGSVINVGSTAGMTGSMTNSRAAHTASKGGVIALTRQLAAEGAPHGIRANAISPGMIATEGGRELTDDPSHPMHAIARSIPLGRLGTPDDVVALAAFLASDDAAYLTGANLVVDGGWSTVLPGANSNKDQTAAHQSKLAQ